MGWIDKVQGREPSCSGLLIGARLYMFLITVKRSYMVHDPGIIFKNMRLLGLEHSGACFAHPDILEESEVVRPA